MKTECMLGLPSSYRRSTGQLAIPFSLGRIPNLPLQTACPMTDLDREVELLALLQALSDGALQTNGMVLSPTADPPRLTFWGYPGG